MSEFSESASPLFEWRGQFDNNELNRLHAECFEHALLSDDWWFQGNRYSLGWVCMRVSGTLVGFLNVAWDGGSHAFLLDTMITDSLRRQGFASRLIEETVRRSKETDVEWLHVDFEPHLRAFYFDACGFKSTDAGLVRLRD
jgi:GNAT superfamily N-acetyltransferase